MSHILIDLTGAAVHHLLVARNMEPTELIPSVNMRKVVMLLCGLLLAGAAASTPIAAAWTAFLGDAIGSCAALDEVYVELSAALRSAGRNYQRSETQATDGFEGGRPR